MALPMNPSREELIAALLHEASGFAQGGGVAENTGSILRRFGVPVPVSLGLTEMGKTAAPSPIAYSAADQGPYAVPGGVPGGNGPAASPGGLPMPSPIGFFPRLMMAMGTMTVPGQTPNTVLQQNAAASVQRAHAQNALMGLKPEATREQVLTQLLPFMGADAVPVAKAMRPDLDWKWDPETGTVLAFDPRTGKFSTPDNLPEMGRTKVTGVPTITGPGVHLENLPEDLREGAFAVGPEGRKTLVLPGLAKTKAQQFTNIEDRLAASLAGRKPGDVVKPFDGGPAITLRGDYRGKRLTGLEDPALHPEDMLGIANVAQYSRVQPQVEAAKTTMQEQAKFEKGMPVGMSRRAGGQQAVIDMQTGQITDPISGPSIAAIQADPKRYRTIEGADPVKQYREVLSTVTTLGTFENLVDELISAKTGGQGLGQAIKVMSQTVPGFRGRGAVFTGARETLKLHFGSIFNRGRPTQADADAVGALLPDAADTVETAKMKLTFLRSIVEAERQALLGGVGETDQKFWRGFVAEWAEVAKANGLKPLKVWDSKGGKVTGDKGENRAPETRAGGRIRRIE